MATKCKNTIGFKPVHFLIFFLHVVLCSPPSLQGSCPDPFLHPLPTSHSCNNNKLSPATVETLLHYVTSNITPQQTYDEISLTLRILTKKSPCNFLVFGLGYDSPMWATLNHGGRTVFLEEDQSWIQQIESKFPTLKSYYVEYDTNLTHAPNLMEIRKKEECKVVDDPMVSKCKLSLKEALPKEVYDVEWDVIMVDAPTGYHDGAPGRMKAIYTAGMMARSRVEGETDVFVHDVDRVVEDEFSKVFLREGYMKEAEGRLRHFTIPSHRAWLDTPFCPL